VHSADVATRRGSQQSEDQTRSTMGQGPSPASHGTGPERPTERWQVLESGP
jgi:hypothetical protein